MVIGREQGLGATTATLHAAYELTSARPDSVLAGCRAEQQTCFNMFPKYSSFTMLMSEIEQLHMNRMSTKYNQFMLIFCIIYFLSEFLRIEWNHLQQKNKRWRMETDVMELVMDMALMLVWTTARAR